MPSLCKNIEHAIASPIAKGDFYGLAAYLFMALNRYSNCTVWAGGLSNICYPFSCYDFVKFYNLCTIIPQTCIIITIVFFSILSYNVNCCNTQKYI